MGFCPLLKQNFKDSLVGRTGQRTAWGIGTTGRKGTWHSSNSVIRGQSFGASELSTTFDSKKREPNELFLVVHRSWNLIQLMVGIEIGMLVGKMRKQQKSYRAMNGHTSRTTEKDGWLARQLG